MASKPAFDDHGEKLDAEVIDSILLVRVDQIDRGDRLREIDPVHAQAIGRLMARDGQNQPIEVCREPGADRWTLVDGAHRCEGAELEDIVYLKAMVVSADRDDRRLREVSAQLWHKGLDPIDRAAFIAEAVAIKKRRAGIDPTKDGRSASANVRWQKQIDVEAADATETIAVAYGWSDELGEQLGLSSRTVRNDLLLYRRLAPSLIAKLREARHPVAVNATQLRALAKLESAEQESVVNLLLHADNVKSVGDAIAKSCGSNRAIDPQSKRLSTFIGSYSRMGLAEKKGALPQLELPAGFKLVEGDAPKASFSVDHERYRAEAMEAISNALEVIDGLIEDEVLPYERQEMLEGVRGELHLTRLMIGGNGLEFAGDA